MDKKFGYFAFALLAGMTIVLAGATWFEQTKGSESAFSLIYTNVWFTLFWVLLATTSFYYMMVNELYRRLPVFALHTAFILILVGALVTRMTGKTGQIHLRGNAQVMSFMDEATHQRVNLPFALSLKSFSIDYYPGTAAPADYISVVNLKDRQGKEEEHTVSMNNILRYEGFRFYQSSFDRDEQGSILSVNHDPWGIGLTYTGYFLMFAAMLWTLFAKGERFRFLLKKLSQKTICVTFLLISSTFFSTAILASTPAFSPDELTVSREQADRWSRVWVEYGGRICPLQTLAADFTVKLTGKDRFNGLSSEQVMLGWLFFPEKWQHIPLFPVKSAEMRRLTGAKGDKASVADFVDEQGNDKLAAFQKEMYGGGQQKGWLKEAVKIDEKLHLIEMLFEGSLLKVFPLKGSNGAIQWFPPNGAPAQPDTMANVFADNFFPLYYNYVKLNDGASAMALTDKLITFQRSGAGETLPSDSRRDAELLYSRLHLFSLMFKICLTTGLLSLLMFIVGIVRNRQYRKVRQVFIMLLALSFAAVTIGIGLRTYICGRIPLSNSYETMLMLAWLSLLTGLAARRYSSLIVPFSLLLAGFALLVAHLGSMNPQMTPLMPVLQSPLLNIHVLTLMVAYGLCGFMTLNSITALSVKIFGRKSTSNEATIVRMKEISELFMYPATFLMGAGIFIGAIWANVSWGRYWGWDPKEVWALITFLLMAFTFHHRTLAWFRRPMVYHCFVLLIFAAVLMTYFGVNLFLGGRHSYGG